MAQKQQKIANSNLFYFCFSCLHKIMVFMFFLFLELFLDKPAMVLRYRVEFVEVLTWL